MYVSVEVIAIIIATATLLVTLGGGALAGFAWIVNRMDRLHRQTQGELKALADATALGFQNVRAETKSDFADFRAEIKADLAAARAEAKADFAAARADTRALADKVDRVHAELHAELTEVKIAVARLEGPMRRLIVPG